MDIAQIQAERLHQTKIKSGIELIAFKLREIVISLASFYLLPVLNLLLEGYSHILLSKRQARKWHDEKVQLMQKNDDVSKLV